MNRIIVAYVPVIHQGYLRFFNHFAGVPIFLLTKELTDHFRSLQKDIRALSPSQIETMLHALLPKREVMMADRAVLEALNQQEVEIIMPDEEVSRAVAAEHLEGRAITWHSVWLRWDRAKSTTDQEIEAHEVVSRSELDQHWLAAAAALKDKSADWWRQVGAVLVKDGQILSQSYNRHVPDEQQPYYDGDPRADFSRGEHIDASTALHAEAGLIADAAKTGMSLAGASLYVTTFPCPNCAKLIAYSGIKKLYFQEGYAMVDGQRILEDIGVEIIRVEK